MKIFKNKFFIIILSAAVFITVLTSTLSVMGKGNFVKDGLNIIATPFRYAAMKINESVEGYKKYFESIDALSLENERLREENRELLALLEEKKGASEENERLRDYLNIDASYEGFVFLDALVTGRQGEGSLTFLTLNKGTGDGVRLGMPITDGSSLVGSVCEVGYNWCRVRLLSEASASAGAYVKRSGETGILSGTVPNYDGKTCIFEYLSENADIEVGDLVYTSGEGSNYPRDIYIGKVTEVKTDKYLRTKTATVECMFEPDDLKYLLIVTDTEAVRESPEDSGDPDGKNR